MYILFTVHKFRIYVHIFTVQLNRNIQLDLLQQRQTKRSRVLHFEIKISIGRIDNKNNI